MPSLSIPVISSFSQSVGTTLLEGAPGRGIMPRPPSVAFVCPRHVLLPVLALSPRGGPGL